MKILKGLFSLFVTLLVPVALLFLGIRLLLTPAFLRLEYRMPGFPADTYGFSLDDRLHWSSYALDYLVNDAGVEYLGDLAFPDGSPLFNERELSHMRDVKLVVKPVLLVGYGSWLLLAVLGLWAAVGKFTPVYRRGVSRGGWLMVGLVVAVAVFAAVAFMQFFTVFHTLFFEGDSWLFLYSDTLIRLFPIRFWQDCFLFAGGIALLGGLLLGILAKDRTGKRSG